MFLPPRKLRVAILADYLEEGWPSMNLVAEMIQASLAEDGRVEAELVRPAMPSYAERYLGAKGRNADRLLGRFVHYPREAARLRESYDVFHVTDHSYSQLVHALPAERCLVTCHDVDTFRCLLARNPEPRPWWFRQMAGRILHGMRRAGHVTCVSENTAREVRAEKWIPEPRLSVIPNGVNREYFAAARPEAEAWIEQWLAGKGLDRRELLLHVGSTIPRKRIDILLQVLSSISKEIPGVQLLRVGGAFTAEQETMVRNLGLAERIHRLPYLEPPQLRALYSRATLVLQPSEYEGFGLPVAEALATGAVVVASDIPVLREVGGEAVAYSAVGEIPAWTRQVVDLLELARSSDGMWQERREAGRQWAQRYQWGSVANALVYQYQYLAGIIG